MAEVTCEDCMVEPATEFCAQCDTNLCVICAFHEDTHKGHRIAKPETDDIMQSVTAFSKRVDRIEQEIYASIGRLSQNRYKELKDNVVAQMKAALVVQLETDIVRARAVISRAVPAYGSTSVYDRARFAREIEEFAYLRPANNGLVCVHHGEVVKNDKAVQHKSLSDFSDKTTLFLALRDAANKPVLHQFIFVKNGAIVYVASSCDAPGMYKAGPIDRAHDVVVTTHAYEYTAVKAGGDVEGGSTRAGKRTLKLERRGSRVRRLEQQIKEDLYLE